MTDDDIKQQARKIGSKTLLEEEYVPHPINETQEQKQDWEILLDNAWEKELQRREGTLEENDRKYEAAKSYFIVNENGKLEELTIASVNYWEDGKLHIKMTAIGYDRFPPDVKEVLGAREDIVDQWVVLDRDVVDYYCDFIHYAHHDNDGCDTWEEYRDARWSSKPGMNQISEAVNATEIESPRETPILKESTKDIGI